MDTDIGKGVDELEEGEIDEKDDGRIIILDDSNNSNDVMIIDEVDCCSENIKKEGYMAKDMKKGRRTLLPDPVGVRKIAEKRSDGNKRLVGGMHLDGGMNARRSDSDVTPRVRISKGVMTQSLGVLQRKRKRPQFRSQKATTPRSAPPKDCKTRRMSYSNWKRNGKSFSSRQTSKPLLNEAEKRNLPFRRRELSYHDLLTQYREIQSQLDDLSHKEGQSGNDDESSVKMEDLGKENIAKTDTNNIDPQNDAQAERNDRRDRLPYARRRISSKSSLLSVDVNDERKEDEDEELELRRIALNSTLQRRVQQESASNDAFEKSPSGSQETLKNIEGINLEDVSVDLDSFPSSPSLCRAINIQKVTSEVDEDVDILRAMLLSSLSNKQLEKSTKFSFVDTLEKQSSTVINSCAVSLKSLTPRKLLPQPKLVPILVPSTPVHDPVVICLNKDDTSDSETDLELDASGPSSLIDSIDSFLNQARQKSEQDKREKDVTSLIHHTPNAIHELPNSDIAEYYKLKAEIRKREQSSGNVSAVTVIETVAKTDTCQVEELNRLEKNLLKHRESMLENQKEIQKVRLQMNNKMTVVNATETKITKLREQLEATINIADTLSSDMKKLEATHDNLVKEMEFNKTKKLKIEKDCLMKGKQLRGALYKLPLFPKVLGIKRKLISNVSPVRWKRRASESQRRSFFAINSAKGNSLNPPDRHKLSSDEMTQVKARLKKMELEVATKLQELRRNTKVASNKSEQVTVLSLEKNFKNTRSLLVKRDRRTSFLNKNPSTRPEETRSGDDSTHAGVSQDCNRASDSVNVPAITLTEQQLEGFRRLQPLSEFVNSFSLDKLKSVPLSSYDVYDVFRPKMFSYLRFPKKNTASEISCTSTLNLQQYTSPLLHFRTYRFSPYFRNKANQCLTWPTYSQKVIPKKMMCRFELPGTCNDDKCTWQHTRDYLMSSKEILCDIVSYCPQLAGLHDGTASDKCQLIIGSYVDNLLCSNKDRMTLDQLCILTVGRVNETLGKAPPHYITFDDRHWHPVQEPSSADAAKCESTVKHKEMDRGKDFVSCLDVRPHADELSYDGDVRYFSFSEDRSDVLESAVLENPTDVDLWLRLANKKLHVKESSFDSIDMALNVLSRGLEVNQHSQELWLCYLGLYSKRKDRNDLAELCDQAVKFSPCYEVWWKCLEYADGYVTKKEICGKMLDYVLKSDVESDVISHRVVELVLYNVQLCILTGRCHQGQFIIEGALGKDTSTATLVDHLSSFDRCILWLCYIHVLEFHCLPSSLFDPSNSGLGRLVRKLPFLLPWRTGHKFKTSLRDLVMTALRKCVQKGQSAKTNAQICLPLYRNLITLEVFRNKYHLAVGICRQLLKVAATDEVYILLARLQIDIGDMNAARETLRTALKSDAPSPYLVHFAAAFEMKNERKEDACAYIGRCASFMFEFTTNEEVPDPELFYRYLLELPLGLKRNNLKLKVSWSYVAEQKLYVWLNYCILLMVKNRDEDVRDAYESAIVRMTSGSDLQIVWIHYLQYVLERFAVSPVEQQDFKHVFSLIWRCVSSVPCGRTKTIGCENSSWTDYSFFNKVVDLYVDVVDNADRVKVYEAFCSLAPTNASLVLRLLRIYMENGRYEDARYLAKNKLETLSNCWDLFKVAIYLAKKDEHFSEVTRLYCEASKSLPYNIQVWKEFICFELSNGRLENAKELIDRCRQLGVAIDGLIDSVLDN